MRTLWRMAALVLVSCVSAPAAMPMTDELCARRGGTWKGSGCMLGGMACFERYADAGKPCADTKQCLGLCLYEGNPEPELGAPVVGTCQRYNAPCGAFPMVEGGKYIGVLWVD